MSTDVVGPVNVVHFGPFGRAGSVIYTPPGNTCDPRYDACTSHHVACDCREAEMAEQRAEWRDEYKGVQEAFDQVLAGHSTAIMGAPNPYTGESDNPCACTGCQIARLLGYYPRRTS